jgi:hypothetical protein
LLMEKKHTHISLFISLLLAAVAKATLRRLR